MTKFYMGGVQQVSGQTAAGSIYEAVTKGGMVVITITKKRSWTVVRVVNGKIYTTRKAMQA